MRHRYELMAPQLGSQHKDGDDSLEVHWLSAQAGQSHPVTDNTSTTHR